jgi:DNA modification methylase/superfamily II DNA or RNA helicase
MSTTKTSQEDVMDYQDFIEAKNIRVQSVGIEVTLKSINKKLFPFQRDVTRWACKKGRCAIFLDTGLGKTFIQLEWARLMSERTLIIAPLSVARQTVREAKKIGLDVKYIRHQSEVDDGKIFITNYEMLDEFDPDQFGAVVLDESSILKSLDGKTRRKLIDMFQDTKYRLACTATPAPNDQSEIGNHAEFLGICSMNEMRAMFFIHANKVDEEIVTSANGKQNTVKTKQSGTKGQEWRLRNHGKDDFYRWMSSWSISLRKPSDLGYDDNGYLLPSLNISPLFVDVDYKPDDQLFFTGLKGIQERHTVRRATLEDRIDTAAGIVSASDDQWIVWCGLNEEGDALESAIEGSIQVQGSDDPDEKSKRIEAFQDGKYRVLVTKPKIAGFGMNFQNAHNMIFVGLSDSWEAYYQCIRREWRFGQMQPVNVYIVLSDVEREIYDNVMQKEGMARGMQDELISKVQRYELEELAMKDDKVHHEYKQRTVTGEMYTAMLGDSCERLKEIESDSVHLSVYSPPFADLYTYSASERDLGNSRDWSEFFTHYAFIIREVLRVTKPGRITCVHTSDIPAMDVKDGYIGMKDFPGAVIRAYESEGWIYHGCAYVQKNPQAQAIRVKAKGLAFGQLRRDSASNRPALIDRVLFFRKDGDNETPVLPISNGEMDNETWIEWANGIWSHKVDRSLIDMPIENDEQWINFTEMTWLGISESDTLQFTTARAADDEKHICPLQLGTIERCIKLYSNPGETVLTPFMGIGSEAYQAIKFGRNAIGIELKESYFKVAVRNLENVERESRTMDLFEYAAQEAQHVND